MSEIVIAIILGIVEGLTEFIPVSSTGHLIVVGNFLGLHDESSKTFEVFIQLGAILAVVVLYFKKFLSLINFSDHKPLLSNGLSGLPGIVKLGVGALPVFILGFLFHKHIKAHLFSNFTVAIGLIVGGLIMLLIENKSRQIKKTELGELSVSDCFLVGLAQCFSLWPGVSRSGATIIGGMLCGLDKKLAAEFSFILAVPVMLVAVSYDLYKSAKFISADQFNFFAVGFIVSFITAIMAIKFFLNILARFSFKPFAVYRIILGMYLILTFA